MFLNEQNVDRMTTVTVMHISKGLSVRISYELHQGHEFIYLYLS